MECERIGPCGFRETVRRGRGRQREEEEESRGEENKHASRSGRVAGSAVKSPSEYRDERLSAILRHLKTERSAEDGDQECRGVPSTRGAGRDV